MYTILPFVEVKLNENDVPGAKLGKFPIEKHSVIQLKRWLSCRKQPNTGKNGELVNRFV